MDKIPDPTSEVIREAVIKFGGKVVDDVVFIDLPDMAALIGTIVSILVRAIEQRAHDTTAQGEIMKDWEETK